MLEQYGVYRLAARPPLSHCIVLSGGVYLELEVIVVVPLVAKDKSGARLPVHHEVEVHGETFVMRPELMASVPKNKVGPIICSLQSERYEIQNAVDRLFSGF